MNSNKVISTYLIGITLEGCANIPTLHIEATYENGEKKERFLTPFRKYCFQVSATINGEGDLGSSPFTMFWKFSNLDKEITFPILWSAATTALYNFCHNGNMPSLNNNKVWVEFIDLCHRWIYGTESNYVIPERTAIPKEKKIIVS